jgi:hypothetical protein
MRCNKPQKNMPSSHAAVAIGSFVLILRNPDRGFRIRALPAQQGQEFRENHRRGAPDLGILDDERRRDYRTPVAGERFQSDASRIHQSIERDFEDARHLGIGAPQVRWGRSGSDDRVQPESAHVNVDWCQRAEGLHILHAEADLLVRLAQRGPLEGFARIDDAARQRHLAAVPLERPGADGQDEMSELSLGAARKEEQQAGRLSNARGIEIRTPLRTRPRRHERLRVGAGQRAAQRGLEPRHDVGKGGHRPGCYGTSVICAQLLFGAGYDDKVTALTISSAMIAYPESFG